MQLKGSSTTSEAQTTVNIPLEVAVAEGRSESLAKLCPAPQNLKLEGRITNQSGSTIPSSVTHSNAYSFNLSYKLPSAGNYTLTFRIADNPLPKSHTLVCVDKAAGQFETPPAQAPADRGLTDEQRSNNKRILRFTIDYPGQGRWLQVVAGQALNMDIHVRDANDEYKSPKGKLRAVAFPYTGKHGKKPKENNQIEVPVLPDPVQAGKFQIKWTPNPGKYEFAILYNSQLIGHKKHFILKVKKSFPKKGFSLFRKK